ncbi:MAG: hypothetical protein GY910_07480 [bacterium]|nr:hypothetical protein [Deltaproteobacteria bacterium]MCP4904805.1 hypothetical protein [bacterium]
MSASPLEIACRRAFSETCDPSAYVPREATESVLAEIRAWAESEALGSSVTALIGTPGLGKTQILRVVESRINAAAAIAVAEGGLLAGRATNARALYLPYAGLEMPDLAIWVHGLLGISLTDVVDFASPGVALGALMKLGGGPSDPFFLIIDDADSMPAGSVQALIAGLPRSGSPLRILLTLNHDSKATRLVGALHPFAPTEISFCERMSAEETADYLRSRMRWADFPGVEIARIDEAEANRLHSLSAGVPQRVHELASARFASAAAPRPNALEEKQRREDWMGRPIGDDLEI